MKIAGDGNLKILMGINLDKKTANAETNQMTQNYKRIAKNTMFLYFRMIIIMAVSFYTIRVVLDTLDVTDFGLYKLGKLYA